MTAIDVRLPGLVFGFLLAACGADIEEHQRTVVPPPLITPAPVDPTKPTQPEPPVQDASVPPAADAIVLPLEVLGPAGTIRSAQFTLASQAAAVGRTLTVRVHGLNYQTAGSVQVNDGAWLDLKNANPKVTVKGTAARLGGIGGAFVTLSLEVALDENALKAGTNTLSFRFNGTDGRSVGYRVLAFNFLDADGHALLGASRFVMEDPSTWVAPRPGSADIAAGKTLWMTATLDESPIHATHKLLAHCQDCHSQDGRDLKYFNYSNGSIAARAIYHGLTQLQGEQIASFIRSNTSSSPGRVWNPPFQPGPNADAVSLTDWSAGAGIDAVLDDDSQVQKYLPGGSANPAPLADPATAGMTFSRLNVREIPLAVQLLDWNHWLPAVSPADALGSVAEFEATDAFKLYQKIRTQLAAGGAHADQTYVAGKLLSDNMSWLGARSDLLAAITAKRGSGTEETFVDNYAAVVWSAQKMWEIVQEFDLQGAGQQLYGLNGERASWFITNRFVFDVSPHAINKISGSPDLTTFQIFGDPTLGNTCPVTPANRTGSCKDLLNTFAAANWYDVQLQLNPGARRSEFSVHVVIDWGYMNNFESTGLMSGRAEPMREARFAMKAMDELDTGLAPDQTAWGWNYRDEVPANFHMSAADSPGGWSTNPGYLPVLSSLYQAWLERSARFDPRTWQASEGTEYDGMNFAPRDYIVGSGSWPLEADGGTCANKGDCLTRSFIDGIAKQLPVLRDAGVPAGLVDGLTEYGSLLYPLNAWDSYRAPKASISAPATVSAVAVGADALQLSWPAVSGASSYNVKRSVGNVPDYLTVAFLVHGTQWVDHDVDPSLTYRYVVSSNANDGAAADALEGADSTSVATARPNGGLLSRWQLGDTLQPGTVVKDVSPSPLNPGQVFAMPTGKPYVSLAQDLGRWLGRSASVTAWVQLPSGPVSPAGVDTGFGIVGAQDRTRQDFRYGLVNSAGKIGVSVEFCDGTTNHSPQVFSAASINDGQWHHVGLTRDSVTGQVQVFIDGVLSGSGVSGTGVCHNLSRSIGRIDGTVGGRVWPGLLKDVRVYDGVLTAQQVGAALQGQ